MTISGHVIALCGGVGGAKLAFGLSHCLPADQLSIIINTGDDFDHLGLHVSPDIDTVVYTLSGLADRERGWGVSGESWNFMAAIRRLGAEDWFQLGDQDLAMHVERTRRLRAGSSLTEVTHDLARALGITAALLPMSDYPVRTRLDTASGVLDFQTYFVRERCRPAVQRIFFDGADSAAPSPQVAALLERRDIAAVIFCPSNPYLSIDPILAVPGLASGLLSLSVPVVAVSPIVGGEAVKGPTAKLMRELGREPENAAIVDHYRRFLTGLVIDQADEQDAGSLNHGSIAVAVTNTVMRNDEDRVRLAGEVLRFAESLGTPP